MLKTWLPDETLVVHGRPYVEHHKSCYTERLTRQGHELRGALYDSANRLITYSQRRVAGESHLLSAVDEPVIERAFNQKRIQGAGLYIGNIFNHYGHFITEGLGAAWYALVNNRFDYFAAHHFVFGDTIDPYMEYCYGSLGISLERILIVKGPTVFNSIVVPQRAWETNLRVFSVCRDTANFIRSAYSQSGKSKIKLYLSRAGITSRNILNEPEIEALFLERGFTIVRPELMRIEEQLALFANVSVMAGLSGSALHNSLFCSDGIPVIEVGDKRSPYFPIKNQLLCNALTRGPIHKIEYRGNNDCFDLDHLRNSLDQVQIQM